MAGYSVTNSVVSLDGVRVRVHRFRNDFNVEDEPTFVLVHGIGVSSEYFLRLARDLVQYGDVVAMDLPGFGDTPRPDRPMSIAGFAAIVHAVMRYENVQNPVVLGHSMGAQVVTELAARDPKWVDRILLIGPPVNAMERTALQVGFRFMQSSIHEPLEVSAFAINAYLRSGLVWFMETLPAMMRYPIGIRLADARARCVLMRGEHDHVASKRWLKDLKLAAESGTDAEVPIIEVEGGAHSVIVRYADAVAQAMIALSKQGRPNRKSIQPLPKSGIIVPDEDGSFHVEDDEEKVWAEYSKNRTYQPSWLLRPPLALRDYASNMRQNLRIAGIKLGLVPGASADGYRLPGAPVALGLPGIVETWRHLESLARALYRNDWDVHLLPQMDYMNGPVQLLALRLEKYLVENDLRDVVIFAHSKGGLVGKMVMGGEQGWRIRAMVSLGTPYAGSKLADYAPQLAGVTNLSPRDESIRRQYLDLRPNSRITSIQPIWDQQVPSGSWLPRARVVTVDVYGHNRVLRVPSAVKVFLEEMEKFKPYENK